MSKPHYDEEEFQSQYNGKTVLRIITLLKKHRLRATGFLLLISIVSVQDAVFAYINKLILDEGILAGNQERLLQLIVFYASLALLQALFVFSFIYLAGTLGERVQYDLRKTMFNHLQNLSFSYFSRTPVGWIISRVTSDSGKIAELVTWGMLDFTWSVLNILTSIIFMLVINWRLALLVLIIIPVMVLLAIEFKKHILTQFRIVRKQNSKLTGVYNETISGVRVIKALCREEQNLAAFSEKATEMYKASYKAAWLSALFLPAIQITGALGLGAILWYGGFQQLQGTMSLGDIQAFIAYVAFMLWPIQQMARVWASMQSALASAERVFSLADATPEIRDRPGACNPGSLKKRITLEHVHFAYTAGKQVFSDFNLVIEQGESVALVGHTGCGKSTLINLICRFYEPQQGKICFDGVEYREFTQHGIQSRIGIVLQVPQLFSGTIRENIRYGNLQATDREIEEAAGLARAHDFIVKLAKGYDTEVGEGGVLLSVGQKQLLSLARAWLANPDIFIMDEATSSIDTVTERRIQKAQAGIFRGRTSIVIAHRLSTIRRVDRIIVLDHGQIREEGDHHTLLAAGGAYATLYARAVELADNKLTG